MDLISYLNLISIVISILLYFYLLYVFRRGIHQNIVKNLNSRFFSIILGVVASVVVLFIAHLVLKLIPDNSEISIILKDEGYSYLIKTLFAILVTTTLIIVFHIELKARAEETLNIMNAKYKELSVYAILYFQSIFKLNDSFEENIILNAVLKNYIDFGNDKKIIVSQRAYLLDIVLAFVEKGYELTSVNSTLIPFWYSPINNDESVLEYTNYFKSNHQNIEYTRITYYHKDSDIDWEADTVGLIYRDLLNSEGGPEYAITWLITLLSKTFLEDVNFPIDFEKNINYFKMQDVNDTVRQIKEIANDVNKCNAFTAYVNSKSNEITKKVKYLFIQSMGEKGCYSCSRNQYDSVFESADNNVTEIGYFKKTGSEFAIFLIGKPSETVVLQVITEKGKLLDIKNKINELKGVNGKAK